MSTKISISRTCECCGNIFTAKTTVTRFCSHKCNSKFYKLKLKEQKIEKSNLDTNAKFNQSIQVKLDKVGIIPYVATSFAERGLILRPKMISRFR